MFGSHIRSSQGFRNALVKHVHNTQLYRPGNIISTQSFSTNTPSSKDTKAHTKSTKKQTKVSPAPLRGTKDLFPDVTYYYGYIEDTIKSTLAKYGYKNELRTPILEHKDVFNSTLGEDSEVVMKQMYLFDDHGIPTVLRPEGTASAIRSLVKRGPLIDPTLNYPDKLYYTGPMFRRERPQAGRLRQFLQFGVESVGSDHMYDDVQLICAANEALTKLNLRDKLVLAINSLGNADERAQYMTKLTEYLLPYKHMLSFDSQKRLDMGTPLRILDSKELQDIYITRGANIISQLQLTNNNGDNNDNNDNTNTTTNPNDSFQKMLGMSAEELVAQGKLAPGTAWPPVGAPCLLDCLEEDSRRKFDTVTRCLQVAGVHFLVDKYLLRGLDYYCHTAFEFLIPLDDGVNARDVEALDTLSPANYSAVLAGGRYDGLSTRFGDKQGYFTSGVGWAAGIDRLYLHLLTHNLLPAYDPYIDVSIVVMMPKVKSMTGLYNHVASTVIPDQVPFISDEMKQTIQTNTSGTTQSTSEASAAVVSLFSLKLSTYLRTNNINVLYEPNVQYRLQLAKATSISKYAIVIGENEIIQGQVLVKCLKSRTQETVPIEQLVTYLSDKLQR